jgi:hypothetical protein
LLLFVALYFSGCKNIQELIRSYEGKDILASFDEKQKSLYETSRQERVTASQSTLRRFLAKLFLPSEALRSNETDAMPYEQRKAFHLEQRKKEFSVDMERIKKLYAKQMEAEKEYLASQKMSIIDLVTKGPPPPPPELIQQPQQPE